MTTSKRCDNINISKGGTKQLRKQFATSIDTDISDNFKRTCDEYNVKMNVVLEAFMKQFSEQQFKIEISKTGIKLKIED